MKFSAEFLHPSDAAKKLGVSTKALRIYEERGLIKPARTAAGWRAYGPDEMARAAEIAALRALGFSLAQIARVLDEDAEGLEQALAAHQSELEGQLRQISVSLEKIKGLRNGLAKGDMPPSGEVVRLLASGKEPVVAFDLPWPWGGERFELREVRPIHYIVGPLFSGKTRLAKRLAETMHNAAFLGLERLEDGGAATRVELEADPALKSRVDRALSWLVEDGAVLSDALVSLLTGLEADGPDILIVDMIEQELDKSSQQALIAHLRRRGPGARPLFLMTRSCEILDLEAVGAHEAIIFCPANHSPPALVAPYPNAPGYEAVASCLAPPEVRARSEGVIAWQPAAE